MERESPPIGHGRPDAASGTGKLSRSRRRSEIVGVTRLASRGGSGPGGSAGCCFFVTTGCCIIPFDRNEDTCAIGPIRGPEVSRRRLRGRRRRYRPATLAIPREPVGRLLIEDD